MSDEDKAALERARARIEELESAAAGADDLRKQVEKLNGENAERRRAEEAAQKEIERLKREGESDAAKAVRAELEEEYAGRFETQRKEADEKLAEIEAKLRRQTLEAAAAKAGAVPEKLDYVMRSLPEDLDAGDHKAVAEAFGKIKQDVPGLFTDSLGGPSDTPGVKGSEVKGKMPESLDEVSRDPATGRPDFRDTGDPYEFFLEASSPGVDAAVPICNFNDTFSGSAPDMGAHETGAPTICNTPGDGGGGTVGITDPDIPPFMIDRGVCFASGCAHSSGLWLGCLSVLCVAARRNRA